MQACSRCSVPTINQLTGERLPRYQVCLPQQWIDTTACINVVLSSPAAHDRTPRVPGARTCGVHGAERDPARITRYDTYTHSTSLSITPHAPGRIAVGMTVRVEDRSDHSNILDMPIKQ
jgi:hypothetical protein